MDYFDSSREQLNNKLDSHRGMTGSALDDVSGSVNERSEIDFLHFAILAKSRNCSRPLNDNRAKL